MRVQLNPSRSPTRQSIEAAGTAPTTPTPDAIETPGPSQFNIHEVKTQLTKIIEQACRGEEVVIARAGKPVVRIVPIAPRPSGRRFGALRGQARVDERFFEPLPDDELRAWE